MGLSETQFINPRNRIFQMWTERNQMFAKCLEWKISSFFTKNYIKIDFFIYTCQPMRIFVKFGKARFRGKNF